MGRGRKQYTHCVPRRWAANQYPFADDTTRGMVEHWCGGTRVWDRDKPLESPRLATCLKCAQAIGKAKLAKLAPRLRLEKRETPLSYDKSTYDLFIDGTLRAHVAIPSGWGEKWYLAMVGDPEKDKRQGWTSGRHGGKVSGSIVDYFTAQHWKLDDESHLFWPVHFASRDAMACAALAYWDRFGVVGLPTLEEARAAEQARQEQRAEEEKERQAARERATVEREKRESLRLERVETAKAGLESLAKRGDLSNVEAAGLAAIEALLGYNGS